MPSFDFGASKNSCRYVNLRENLTIFSEYFFSVPRLGRKLLNVIINETFFAAEMAILGRNTSPILSDFGYVA